MKVYLELLKGKVDDYRKYFDENPSEVKKCVELVNGFRVNRELMMFFEADSELELLDFLTSSGLYNLFKDSIIELCTGNRHVIVEGYSSTVKGKEIYIQVRTYIPEMFYSTWKEAVVIITDLTEKKNLESRLREKAEKYEFLIDLMTHDLKNFHFISQTYLELVLKGSVKCKGEKFTSCLENSRKSIIKGTNLLKNVSVLMKTQLNAINDLEPILLRDILVKVKEFTLDTYQCQNIQISLEKVPKNLMIRADSIIEHLFINLFTNAIKNDQNEVKRIEVTAFQEGDLCHISVIDYGTGISMKKREQIFTRYSEFKNEVTNSGLGLFIVKTLVDRYYGEITVESRIKNDYTKGTRFNVVLNC
ncbi:MAG: sensor histidine kinase [Candidatus Hodarchaeales archaeon]